MANVKPLRYVRVLGNTTGFSELQSGETIDKADVGLPNVDNTSDADKPVSTAQATALGLKLDASAAYVHPVNHPPAIIAQDADNRFVTDAEKAAWSAKQDVLVSGTNLKTVNGTSLLGAGDIVVSSGSSGYEQTFLMMGA